MSVNLDPRPGDPFPLTTHLLQKIMELERENAALRAALTGMVREFDFIKPLQQEKVVLEKARAALDRKEAQP